MTEYQGQALLSSVGPAFHRKAVTGYEPFTEALFIEDQGP
jgi:hypothetical protein